MKRKTILIVIVFLAIVLGAGYAVVARGNTPAKKESNQKETQKELVQPKEEKPIAFNKTLYSIDDPTSIWTVVNKTRPLQPKNYVPEDLVAVGGGQRMRKAAADALGQLFQGAKEAGYVLKPLSGYRSYSTQVSVYNNEVKTNGQSVADSQSARPGTSEHQTGLAIDVGGGGCGIEDCFGNTPEGAWLAANGYKYGFIIRYTADKVPITGYRYEPWHIRYIGVELSTEMHTTGIKTLEEFFNLPAAPGYN